MIYSFVNGLCKHLFVSTLFETKVGIKCFNQLISSDLFEFVPAREVRSIPADHLYLLFDGLKDKYSLINENIMASPHFGLMVLLSERKDISHSDYVERASQGTLDLNLPRKVNSKYIQHLVSEYERSTHSVSSGKYKPIKVIQNDGRYFIADGKHTAALCALRGISPKYVDVTPIMSDSFIWWLYRKMLKNRDEYTKHIRFFESIEPNPSWCSSTP